MVREIVKTWNLFFENEKKKNKAMTTNALLWIWMEP